MEKARDGDLDAFEQLVRRFQDMAVGYAYSILRDFDSAEDAAQEAFIRAYRHLPQIESPAAFPAWFRRVVQSCCNRLTRGKRLATVPLSEADWLAAPAPDPAAAAQKRETQDKVLEAVGALPDDQRAVTTLFYINGYSLAEVGEFLDVPVSTVKNRLHTARNQLRERMTNMIGDTLKQHAPGPEFSEEVRRKIPHPFDEAYDPSDPGERPDRFREQLILSAFPPGSEIIEVNTVPRYFPRSSYITVRTPDGGERQVETKASYLQRGAETEAKILPVLGQLGLPVQEIVAGPTADPDRPETGPIIVLSHLPGEFPPYHAGVTVDQLDFHCRIVLAGVSRLQQLTEAVRKHPVAKDLPERTLVSELEESVKRGGPWMKEQVFAGAVDRLFAVLKKIKTPLVFSNGLNISWNFLHDKEKVCGFVGFDHACFEDPHIQFAKYKYWEGDRLGWGRYNQVGLVERWLYTQNVSRAEFAPRLALRCLWNLQREVSVSNEQQADHRDFILGVLKDGLACLC